MEVEYLDEDEENFISEIDDYTDTNSNECNVVTSQKRKTSTGNEYNNLQKSVTGKENIYRKLKNYTDIQQSTAKIYKSTKESGDLLNNTNSVIQNVENNKKLTPFKEKGRSITRKELKNTIEMSTQLNNVYEKTYELKKGYYESKLEYLRRFMEANEKIANTLEKLNFSH